MDRDRVNLSDPGVEPTDEQLDGLMRRAFANVEQAHQARLAQRREAVRLRVATPCSWVGTKTCAEIDLATTPRHDDDDAPPT